MNTDTENLYYIDNSNRFQTAYSYDTKRKSKNEENVNISNSLINTFTNFL